MIIILPLLSPPFCFVGFPVVRIRCTWRLSYMWNMVKNKMFVSHSKPPLLELNIAVIVQITILLPIASIICCVLTALFLHFEESTRTHCGVSTIVLFLSLSLSLSSLLYNSPFQFSQPRKRVYIRFLYNLTTARGKFIHNISLCTPVPTTPPYGMYTC